MLGVARSSLSRYESEKLGLPVHALNRCLTELASRAQEESSIGPAQLGGLVHQASRLLDDLHRLAETKRPPAGRDQKS